MSKRKGRRPQGLVRGLRLGISLILLLMLATTVIYLISRLEKKPRISSETREIPQQKVERAEQVSHLELRGEKGSFALKANKHYLGEDNQYYLEGSIEVIDFGKTESENVTIRGEKVVYDRDMVHFTVEGASRVTYRDWLIESDLLQYDKTKGEITGDRGIRFQSPQLKGSAPKMSYTLWQETLRLFEKVQVELPQKTEAAPPLVVEAENLTYSRRERKGKVQGKVSISQGKSSVLAQTMEFFLSDDENEVESIFLKGDVKATLIDGGDQVESRQKGRTYLLGGRRYVEAGEVRLTLFQGNLRLSGIQASGGCRYTSGDESGGSILVDGESLDFELTAEGELDTFRAFGEVRIVEQQGESGGSRNIEGQEIILDQKSNTLTVRGGLPGAARLASQGNEINADEIILFLDSENLEASGGVMVVYQGSEERGVAGFFPEKKPVFVSSQKVRYSSSEGRFIFGRKVRIWQDKQMLAAEEVSLSDKSGEVDSRGKVKAVFFAAVSAEQDEERVEVSADSMKFIPGENTISFERDTVLATGELVLRADFLSIRLKESRSGIEAVNPRGNVDFTWKKVRGKAGEVLYDPPKKIMVLTGNPVLEERGRGVTRGDKLTFHMGDGRIVVQNRARERSVTVIKS